MRGWLAALWRRLDDWLCGTDCDPAAYDPEHPDETEERL